MIEIEKPQIECIETPGDASYGKYVIEPLERGYGTTLGNALRRIMLSSLPGTAATSIKIAGVQHEFSTIPGVKEDVTEIVLNVKSLLTKLHCEGTKTVYIEAAGPCEVTAGDIKSDGEVEVLNPELHLATLDVGATLSMEITLSHGRGYVSADRNKAQRPGVIGVIPIDSIYTPVYKVNYTVENTRVGSMSDFDKLTLEVWTDSTISARDAVSLGAKILCDHFALFTDLSDTLDGQPHRGGEVRGSPEHGAGYDHRRAGPVRPQLQLPQARQHQHGGGSDLQDRGRDDEGAQPGPQVPGGGHRQAGRQWACPWPTKRTTNAPLCAYPYKEETEMPGTRKLGKTTDQRMAMLRQQVTDFLDNGRMETTVTRAKEIKPLAEKMITLGKKGDLAAYRQALSFITREDRRSQAVQGDRS